MKRYISYLTIGLIVFFTVSPSVFAGTLNLLTEKTQFAIGDEFTVDVKIDSEGASINAAQATVNYPVGVLQEKSVDKSNSIFSFWLQEPTPDNSAGEISFIGGSSSGLTGKTLQALTITFKVVGSGPADISFSNGAITAADGNGTNVLSSMKGLSITSITKNEASTIIPAPKLPPVQLIQRTAVPTGKSPVKPSLVVPLYPVSGDWYNTISSFIVRWQLPSDITSVATLLNQQPVSDLKTSEGLFDNKTFPVLKDGIWYLHVRFKNDIGWGPTADYKIGIDTVPPLPFDVSVPKGNPSYITTPTITFETKDQPSGIALYRISIDGTEATSTLFTSYVLPAQPTGKHTVVVAAEDGAGNKTSTTISLNVIGIPFLTIGAFSLTQFQFFAIMILILLALFGVWWFFYLLWQQQLERRVIIAERDIGDTLNVISQDAEKIIDLAKGDEVDTKEVNEVGFLAQKIKDKADKSKRYIIENVREISQK